MDADLFDRLTRSLRATPSRRLTIGTMVTAGLAALLGRDAAEAAPKKKGAGKKGGKQKKKKKGPTASPPPPGIGECLNFNLPSGCRNVPGTCCVNFNCQPCPADSRCCAEGAGAVCKKGNCCTDADCQSSPLKFCSKGTNENMCL
jgi:hypothetical protein